MTDNEIRIAIAEKCGVKNVHIQPKGRPDLAIEVPDTLPNYPNDLNAVHEVEKIVAANPVEWSTYLSHLEDRINFRYVVMSTARQRCEALLRTWGLWKEAKT